MTTRVFHFVLLLLSLFLPKISTSVSSHMRTSCNLVAEISDFSPVTHSRAIGSSENLHPDNVISSQQLLTQHQQSNEWVNDIM
jgi:hypothetical protein